MSLIQSLCKENLSAVVASSVMSLVALTRGEIGVWGQLLEKIFDSVFFILT